MIKVPYGSSPELAHKHAPGSLAARVPKSRCQAETGQMLMEERQEGVIPSHNTHDTKHVPYQGKGQGSCVGKEDAALSDLPANLLHKATDNIN